MRGSSLVTIVLVAGCAKAGIDNSGNGPDASGGKQDGSTNPMPDASQPPDAAIDAAPVQVTLSQTTNQTVAAANSVACSQGTETRDNSWYRVFALTEHGISNKPFNVQSVTFAMQESAGSPQVQVKIGTYAGALGGATLDLAQVTPINSTTATVPPTTTGVSVTAPITGTIPANGQIIVEILSPDLLGTGGHNFIGASNGGQTRPSYIRSTICAITAPQNVATVGGGFPNSHFIITVTGTH
jgi:hypothetical protein